MLDTLVTYLPGKSSPLSLVPIFPLQDAHTTKAADATAFGGNRTLGFFRHNANIRPANSHP
ncbi:hypothetical protein ACFWY9_42455 [Amycolatopsis sp. NPDC059027]|uniref:hypothetical protein n=1 Tax=unclassified Amycolatopsis TaxID=2618356 RepID=UPI00366FC0C4